MGNRREEALYLAKLAAPFLVAEAIVAAVVALIPGGPGFWWALALLIIGAVELLAYAAIMLRLEMDFGPSLQVVDYTCHPLPPTRRPHVAGVDMAVPGPDRTVVHVAFGTQVLVITATEASFDALVRGRLVPSYAERVSDAEHLLGRTAPILLARLGDWRNLNPSALSGLNIMVNSLTRRDLIIHEFIDTMPQVVMQHPGAGAAGDDHGRH